jgi:hypothetical protein
MNSQTLSHVDMKTKLSALWTFVLINMIFADIFSFMNPGFVRQMAAGDVVDGTRITPAFLLVAAMLTEISMAMVVLPRLLNYRANRWANILGGLFTVLWVIAGGSATPTYIFISSVEVICSAWIIWLAWQWRAPEGQGR